ncbi:MAG: hypothetical protein AB1Z66_10340 [Candidatus Limnocylindrales bacterium]
MDHRSAAIVVVLCALLASATTNAAEAPDQEVAWLSGTFGTVVGGDQENPATAAPDARPLDTWMRSAPLEFGAQPPLSEGDSVTFEATSLEDDQTIELALAEQRWVTAPDAPGLHRVVATIMRPTLEPTRHAWLLDVPDRPGSWEVLLERPAIEGSLVGITGGSVSGLRGRGCLTGFCQEVGYRPPVDVLEPLAVRVGEPLALELSDGSAVVGWEGRLEPQSGTASETRLAEAAFDKPVAGPALVGLEPDVAGEWLLEVRVDYDRERGWQWYLFRLVAE